MRTSLKSIHKAKAQPPYCNEMKAGDVLHKFFLRALVLGASTATAHHAMIELSISPDNPMNTAVTLPPAMDEDTLEQLIDVVRKFVTERLIPLEAQVAGRQNSGRRGSGNAGDGLVRSYDSARIRRHWTEYL